MASKKSKKGKKPHRRTRHRRRQGINPRYMLIPVTLVLLVGGVWLLATLASSPGEPRLVFYEGPRLVFGETSFDFGTVPLNTVVEHDFVYRNLGDAPLVLQAEPEIEAIEGC